MAIYYVDVSVELDNPNILLDVTGDWALLSPNAITLNPGDQVGFRYVGFPLGVTLVAGSWATTHWTDITTLTLTDSYQFKTASATIPSTIDSVTITGTRTNYNTKVVDGYYKGPSEVTPTYSVTAPTSINEGSAGSMSVATTNVADSTTLYWTVTPAGDFGTSSGSFTITSNAGSFNVTPSADSTTEGPETGTIQIRTGSISGDIVASDTFTINDTSTTPIPTYSVTAPESIDEGSAGSMSVATTNVADSTTLYWTVTPAGDFGTSSGSFTITSNAGSFNVTPLADSTTEGEETGTIEIRTGSTGGDRVAYADFTINDTSTTPQDTTPDQFTFTDIPDVALDAPQTSNSITISGMSAGASAAVSITGGTYSKNGGAYTSATGTAVNGDTFTVQHTSSSSNSTSVNTTLTVGGISDTFTTTTVAFTGTTYYVDAQVTADFEDMSLLVYLLGDGVAYPKQLNAGDRVGFKYSSAPSDTTITATGFISTHWTNTSSLTLTDSYQYKIVQTGIPVNTANSILITADKSGWTSDSQSSSFIGSSTPPDIEVTPTSSSIPSTATSASTTVTDVTVGEYYAVRVNNGSINLGVEEATTTSVTITFSSELPTTVGIAVTYEIYSMRPIALGGSGIYTATDDTFTITTYEESQPPVNPLIDNYGLAVYADDGAFITSFSQDSSVLRTIFKTTVTLSPSGDTDIATGLTGLSSSNCVIQVRLEGGTASILSVSTTFISGTTVRIAPYSAVSVVVTVLQYAGRSIGVAADTYGIEIRNGNNSIVIDEGALTYGVREIINGGNTSRVTTGTQISSNAKYGRIELIEGDYPSSNGTPVAAINCTAEYPLIPPSVGSTTWPDGSYRYVYFFIPVAASYSSYNIAMLVPSNIATPSYYDAADTYGLDIKNSSNQLVWSSRWRQAIVNNVVPINIFSEGVSQNGTYDVTVGADGVTPPPLTQIKSEFIEDLTPVGESVGVSSLNSMDPLNTYLMGDTSSGKVSYYTGKYWYDDFAYIYAGGGVFVPAATITSSTSVSISMWRQFFPGFDAPAGIDESSRDTNSKHPEGSFIFLRIV